MAYYYSHYQSQRNLIIFLTNQKNPKQNKTKLLDFLSTQPELLKIFQQNSPPYYGLSSCPNLQEASFENKLRLRDLHDTNNDKPQKSEEPVPENLVNCSLASPRKRYSFSLQSCCYCSCRRRHPLSDHDPSFTKPQAQSMTQRTTAGAALETELDCLAATKQFAFVVVEKTIGIAVSFEQTRKNLEISFLATKFGLLCNYLSFFLFVEFLNGQAKKEF